ncbi:sensor histidine kinase [Litoribacter populi]|uniref:sensor histidine kinase n=1 Tax=Litoribacter populi TaxID=2598460 RepID=UPI00117E72F8|nr:HAMP domain-containing sensor histidine kinase [Litoribacter populi]
MNRQSFSQTGFWIVLTLMLTIGIQVYRNYQNYQLNQKQLQSDIQLCLDNSVEAYYAELAKSDIVTFTQTELDTGKIFFSSIRTRPDSGKMIIKSTETAQVTRFTNSNGLPPFDYLGDSIFGIKALFLDSLDLPAHHINTIKVTKGPGDMQSQEIKELTNRIIISLSRDTLDFGKLNGYLQEELDRQKISIDYALLHYNREKISGGFNREQLETLPKHTLSKSTLLPKFQRLEMHFENSALQVLQRGMADLLISLLFLGVVAGSFGYLYRTIRSQKELAAIKNDLINNITHEFKTPIATVTSALEGIEHFNRENNPEKTKRYLDISNQQLLKLNIMVEKLLETATMDSEHLMLQKETLDLKQLLSNLVEKYKSSTDKAFILDLPEGQKEMYADPFHLENAISNLIDNAIKYGGDKILVSAFVNGSTQISISDNGGNIPVDQKDKVFEQFYRIPKGNLHDVKGFGIGLYYTKKIVEKHGGNIHLDLSGDSTTFKIHLP